MSLLLHGVAAAYSRFQEVAGELRESSEYSQCINLDALDDELGRFRVWMGNIGALQKGHSSLDYRLRDSPILRENTWYLIRELSTNLSESLLVLRHVRLPYEQQAEALEDDCSSLDSSDGSEDEFVPRGEIEQRLIEITDIIDNLYKLSRRIRTPVLSSRGARAATYRPVDKETGVDILACYEAVDRSFTRELLVELRRHVPTSAQVDKDDYLLDRLSKAITFRRQRFMYWKRHRDKLATWTDEPHHTSPVPAGNEPASLVKGSAPLLDQSQVRDSIAPRSEAAGLSILSTTTATRHHGTLDEAIDIQSVTSVATTVYDIAGNKTSLPPPPTSNGKDFECPYCFTICPARYESERAWRTHLLRDLCPYICTDKTCTDSSRVFKSQKEWTDHEATHRQVWRCPEHPAVLVASPDALIAHFSSHDPDSQISTQASIWVDIAKISLPDTREECPICYLKSERVGNMQKHLAHHLERFAAFALPKNVHLTDDISENQSTRPPKGSRCTASSNMSSLVSAWSAASNDGLEIGPRNPGLSLSDLKQVPEVAGSTIDVLWSPQASPSVIPAASTRILIRGFPQVYNEQALPELLTLIPGYQHITFASHDRRKIDGAIITFENPVTPEAVTIHLLGVFPQQDVSFEIMDHTRAPTRSSSQHLEYVLVPLSRIPTAYELFRNGTLTSQPTTVLGSTRLNDKVSLIFHDITRLDVEVIVNVCNRNMRRGTGHSVSNAIHTASGVRLAEECSQLGECGPGQAKITDAYNLPNKKIIHTVVPTYRRMDSLGSNQSFSILRQCYQTSLKLAVEHNLRTIAFPCIGASTYPMAEAATNAISECRRFLESDQGLHIDRLIFCVYTESNFVIYKQTLPQFFPIESQADSNISLTKSPATSPQTSSIALPLLPGVPTDIKDSGVYQGNLVSHLCTEGSQINLRLLLLETRSANLIGDVPLLRNELSTLVSALGRLDTYLQGVLNYAERDAVATRVAALLSSIQYTLGHMSKILEVLDFHDGAEADDLKQTWSIFYRQRYEWEKLSLLDIFKLYNTMIGAVYNTQLEWESQRVERVSLRELLRRQVIVESFSGKLPRGPISVVPITSNEPLNTWGDEITLDQIPSLTDLYKRGELRARPTDAHPDEFANNAILLIRHDITKIAVDAVVNSTNESFDGGGRLEMAIMGAAGPQLLEDYDGKLFIDRGEAIVTPGYSMPCRILIHTVPPAQIITMPAAAETLRQCYRSILALVVSSKARTIAIPVLGTGMLHNPPDIAVHIAVSETASFLEKGENRKALDKIVFCVFTEEDEEAFHETIPLFFPPVAVVEGK